MERKAPPLKDGVGRIGELNRNEREIIKAACQPKAIPKEKGICPLSITEWPDPIKAYCGKDQDAQCADCPLYRGNRI